MHVWLSLLWGSLLPSLGPGAHKVLFVPSKHLLRVSALILNMTTLLLPSCCSFSFALGLWVPFSGMFQHSPVDGCSEASCDFGVLAGADKRTSFYSAILDCSLSVSSAHGILQARILEWVAIPFSRGSSDPGIEPGSPALQAYCFTIWATREVIPMRWLNINILFGST